ncbi:MAG TPA: PEP-CTERM sorting domain-containing protein [Rhizomicrobium sp.]|nr:PEP-CTERM sorting domain-containing protein [Rhizomicrobium sp.]
MSFAVVAALAAAQPASAEVFTIGDSFTVSGGNSPDSFSQSVPFQTGTVSLDGGALNLTISIVPLGDAAQNEWVVFQYQTANGDPLSLSNLSWHLDQIGLPAAVPVNFVGDFTQFTDANGTPFDQTISIFGQGLMGNPVPGGAGNGEGTLGYAAPFPAGPLPDLGAFANPFGFVTNALGTTDVYGFTQALEFAPQTPITPPSGAPEPLTFSLFAAGLAGLGVARRRKA